MENNTPVYSPSQTETWGFCPVKRQLERQGYRPRMFGKMEIAGAMGQGLAAGLAAFYSKADPIGAASAALGASLSEFVVHGRVCNGRDLELFNQAAPKVHHALHKILVAPPIPPTWPILAIEHTLVNHGNARLDLAVRDPHNIAIVDWKLKLDLPAGFRTEQAIREYAHKGQMFHYCWAYGEEMNELVTRFYIGLVVLEPRFYVKLIPYEIEPEAMQMWKISQQQKWTDMAGEDRGERIPYQAAVHFDRYGQCPFYKACFTHKYHEHLMLAEDYVKVVKEGK